jgi:hypothetical protein
MFGGRASSYLIVPIRPKAVGRSAGRIVEQGRWVFAISLARWRRRRIALAAARPCYPMHIEIHSSSTRLSVSAASTTNRTKASRLS